MRNNPIKILVAVLMTVMLTFSSYSSAQPGDDSNASADVLIAYYTLTGTTLDFARYVSEGANLVAGVTVTLKPIEAVTAEEMINADGIILGSPTYFGNMAGPMKTFIDRIGLEYGNPFFGGKIGGAFSTGGGSAGGKEHVIVSLLLAMINTGMMVAGPSYGDGQSGYALPGAAAVDPGADDEFSENEIEDARRLGQRIAEIAKTLAGPE